MKNKLKKIATYFVTPFLVLALVIIVKPQVAFAAISVDSKAGFALNTTTNTSTFNHTIVSLNNSVVVISILARGASKVINTVTVNGSNATLQASTSQRSVSNTQLSNIWDFVATSSGNQQIIVTASATFGTGMTGSSTVLNGVNTTTPQDGAACNNATGLWTGGNSTVTTAVASDYLVDALMTRNIVGITVGTSQTAVGSNGGDGSAWLSGISYKAATTTGSQSMFWTWNNSTSDWISCTVAYQPAAAAAGTTGTPKVVITGQVILRSQMVL